MTREIKKKIDIDVFFEDYINQIKLMKKLNSEGAQDPQISDFVKSLESSLKSYDEEIDNFEINLMKILESEFLEFTFPFNVFFLDLKKILEGLYFSLRGLLRNIEFEEISEKNLKEITDIRSIINDLTQNINNSKESIKGNIQLSIQKSFERLPGSLRTLIPKIIPTEEEVRKIIFNIRKNQKVSNYTFQKLIIFTEKTYKIIDQMNEEIKEIEITQYTASFESFVKDLMEILENIFLSLKNLSISKPKEKIMKFVQDFKAILQILYALQQNIDPSIEWIKSDIHNLIIKRFDLFILKFKRIFVSRRELERLKKEEQLERERLKRERLEVEKKEREEMYKKEKPVIEKLIQEMKFSEATLKLKDIRDTAKIYNLNEINGWAIKRLDKLEREKLKIEKINSIKKTVLNLGLKFARLQIVEISEVCGIDDIKLIVQIVKDMIDNKEIYAQYFSSTKSVAFDQQANIDEIDKLMTTYKDWEDKEIGKK